MRVPTAEIIALQNGDLEDWGDLDNAASAVFAAAEYGYELPGGTLVEAMEQLDTTPLFPWQEGWDDATS